MPPIQPRGPAHDGHLSSVHPSNPYNFPPELWKAGKLPPKVYSTPPHHLSIVPTHSSQVTDSYVFFFGYEGPEPEVCLQQWFPCPMTDDKGNVFPTTEHYMMYHKALLMGDEKIAAQILREPHPSAAKYVLSILNSTSPSASSNAISFPRRLGREVSNFDLEIWKRHADQVVEDANYLKFSQNADMKEVLLGTGEKTLVEASPDDKIWGIGFNSENAEGKEGEWGNNGLGKALMKVRARLR